MVRLVLLIPALLLAAPAVRADEPTREELRKLERQLVAANANAGPAIACVVVSRSDKYPRSERTLEPGQLGGFDREAFLKETPSALKLANQLDLSRPDTIPDHGFAGGLVIDAAGLVLVNYSTIDGAAKVFVHLPGTKGSYANVHAADARSDLAVLKLLTPPEGLKPIRFGRVRLPDFPNDPNATTAPGKLGLVMAYPYASGAVMDRPNGGLGRIASIRTPEPKDSSELFRSIYNYAPVFEIDSTFHPGVGGAVFLNLDGEAIGLTTATAAIPSDAGRAFAMPIDDNLLRIIEVLGRGEEVEYGFLGVTRPEPFRRGRGRGLHLDRGPLRNSPAFAAGLRVDDLITRINDHPVNSFEDLLLQIGSGLAGRKLKLRFERDGRPHETEVQLAKFRNQMPYIASVRPAPIFGLRVDYSSVMAQALFNPFGGRLVIEIPRGVHVRELVPHSPAAAKFKALGDNDRWVITQVNGVSVLTPTAFYKEARGAKSLKLTVTDPTEPGVVRTVVLP
jgi:S1-C subfamily serine protease